MKARAIENTLPRLRRAPLGCVLGLSFAGACGGSGGSSEPDAASPSWDGGTGDLCTSCGDCEEHLSISSAKHVEGDVEYDDAPPVGGDHSPCWTSWGAHDDAVPDERWVHNLEHGGVVFAYRCEEPCAKEQRALEALAEGRAFAVVTPYAGLPKRFAAIAWGYRLVSDCLDEATFRAFYDAHRNHAPEATSADPPDRCL